MSEFLVLIILWSNERIFLMFSGIVDGNLQNWDIEFKNSSEVEIEVTSDLFYSLLSIKKSIETEIQKNSIN